jgi:hypothetical protein
MATITTGIVETYGSEKGYYCLCLVEPVGSPAGLVLEEAICTAQQKSLHYRQWFAVFFTKHSNVLIRRDATKA